MERHGPRVQAVRLVRPGAPLVVSEVDLPTPGPGEVLVELAYGGINPVDRYVAEGRVAADGPLPRTLGSEASGYLDGRPVVVAHGDLGRRRDGVWASAAVVPAEAVVPLSDGVDLRAAAALGIAGATAWRVVQMSGVSERSAAEIRTVVLGASGGVGSMVVSLLAAKGIPVLAQSGSPDKAEFLRTLGAAEVVIGGPEALVAALATRPADYGFDCLGGDFAGALVSGMATHGRIVVYGTSAGPTAEVPWQTLYRNGLSVVGYGGLIEPPERVREALEAAVGCLERGELRVAVERVVAPGEVEEAFGALVRREVCGKLVVGLG